MCGDQVFVISIGVLKVNGAEPFWFVEFFGAQLMRHLLKTLVVGAVAVSASNAFAGGLPESTSGISASASASAPATTPASTGSAATTAANTSGSSQNSGAGSSQLRMTH